MLILQNMAGNPEIFDELVINHDLTIPENKPPMERLLGYKVKYEITKAEVIATPLQSDDQPPLPIRKVILEGIAKITIKYVAAVEDQQVHGAHFDVPFSKLLIWPGGPAPSSPLCIDVLEEHVQFHMLDERHISKLIVIQVNVSVNMEGGGNCGN